MGLEGPIILGSYSVIRSTNGHSLDRTLLYFTLKRPTASRFGHPGSYGSRMSSRRMVFDHPRAQSMAYGHRLCRYKWPTATYTSTTLGLLLLLFYCTIEGYDWPKASHIPASPNGPFRAHQVMLQDIGPKGPMSVIRPYYSSFIQGSGCPKGSPHIVQYLKYGMWPKATCLLYNYFLILLTKLLLRSNSLAK